MEYRTVISAEVASQILAASSYLDGIRLGLGQEFENEVEAILKLLSKNPNLYPVEFGPVRRAFVRRFKQVVYYAVRGNAVVIIEIRDARRKPPNWGQLGYHRQ